MTPPKNYCVRVPWEYISMYVDTVINFAKLNQDYHILQTTNIHTYIHTTYRMSDHIVSFWTRSGETINIIFLGILVYQNVPVVTNTGTLRSSIWDQKYTTFSKGWLTSICLLYFVENDFCILFILFLSVFVRVIQHAQKAIYLFQSNPPPPGKVDSPV